MLKHVEPHRPVPAETPVLSLDLASILSMVRRQILVLAAGAGIGLLVAAVFVLTAEPQFKASAQILIDSRKASAVQDLSSGAPFIFDPGSVESQVIVVQSKNVAEKVIDQLKLMDTSERLLGPKDDGFSLFGAISSLFGAAPQLTPEMQAYITRRSLVAVLTSNIEARRIGRTYALEITFTARDQVLAAEVANAYAKAYIEDQLGSKYDATRRASDWMQSRIQELRQQALASDMAVQRFKAESNLTTAGGGLLLSDQEMSQIMGQLVAARSDKALADARARQIQDIIDSGDPNTSISESINNGVIADLRGKYLRASKMKEEFEAKYGPTHLQVVALRDEMNSYRRLMMMELERLAASLKSEAEIAGRRVESLEASISGMSERNVTDNQAKVTLRELEREAMAYDAIYQEFLKRYQENIQQQTFAISEARIITPADIPLGPTMQRTYAVGVALFILCLGAAGGVGALREYRDRGFRTSEQVRQQLGFEVLGLVPLGSWEQPIRGERHRLPTRKDAQAWIKRTVEDFKREWMNTEGRELSSAQRAQVLSMAASHPTSLFAETMRAVKVAIDVSRVGRPSKIIGVVSTLPGEGKTTVAKNLASCLAQTGSKTILIDADLRNPGLTKSLFRDGGPGLVDVLMTGSIPREAMKLEPRTGLVMIPCGADRKTIPHVSEVIASSAMRRLLEALSRDFDYIVVDLPPIGPVIDARAAAPLIDSYLLVVEWGRTPRSSVVGEIRKQYEIANKVLGVVLNKVEMDRLGLYEDAATANIYMYRYKSYVDY